MNKLRALMALTASCLVPAAVNSATPQGSYRARLPEDEVIYFLLPDRFENGDPSNDRGGIVLGVVVDDQYIPTHAGRNGHAGETVERLSERPGAVICADEHGRGW